jgi:hypothetical protein
MRHIAVSIVAVSTLFACHALADASQSVVGAPALSATVKGGRNTAAAPARPAATRAAQTAQPRQSSDAATSLVSDSAVRPPPAQPAQQDPGPVCCCRYFAQGWQHAWRGQAACDSAGGTCVAPDHCRQ